MDSGITHLLRCRQTIKKRFIFIGRFVFLHARADGKGIGGVFTLDNTGAGVWAI